MARTARKMMFPGIALALLLGGASARAAVRGRALLLDAPHRCKPGDLLLCLINGKERKFEALVKGKVVDARFSPDGKEIVYGVDGKIRIMDLKTRKPREVCPYEAGKDGFTYFNWGLGNKIYWSGGKDTRQIFSVDIKTKQKTEVHKGNKGRSTVSLDGKKAAWVMPPVAAFTGGKQYRFTGGCGGAVSPSGKYLTSNLTTTHMLMGIFTFGADGPSKNPMTVVSSPGKYAFNGFSFGRNEDWVCYVLEHPKKVSPTSYICYWRTGDHIRISEFGKYCIKDFFDETDVLPAGAKLEKITICSEGPTDTPLEHEFTNVGLVRRLKVVGHYTAGGAQYTPQLREGITWKVDKSKLAVTASTYKGLAEAGKVTVTAEYKGKRDSFDVTLLPKLTGDGFKAEYFKDADFKELGLTRVDPKIYFRWGGSSSPDKSINGRKPWSARWTGMVAVQTEGEYTFYFLQGEGNDRFIKDKDGKKTTGWSVWVDGKLVLTITKGWNYPWVKPRKSAPIRLKKGMHSIKVMTADNRTAHPVVAELYWSGPNIKMSLLGGGYVHSKAGAAKKATKTAPPAPAPKRPVKASAAPAQKKKARTPGQVCTGYFSSARNYRRVGMKADAQRCLSEIIRQFPGTEWARKAREELRKL